MWVYRKKTSGWFSVGFYLPAGSLVSWYEQSEHDDEQDAMMVVNYLNGGTGAPIQ